ncbi:MAG: glycosyltransferase [Victivallales bacterium]|nr:glycosyltransferase [Victivallales bacterium]
MKRVLIYYKGFSGTPGGSEQRVLFFIAHLQQQCQVTLALCFKSDLEMAARMYGVPIDLSRLEIVVIKPQSRLLQRLDNCLPFYRTRRLKALARQADVCISAMNTADFGRPAHHFIVSLTDLGDNAFTDFVLGRKRSGIARLGRAFRHFVAECLLRPLLGVRSPRTIITDSHEKIYPNSLFVERLMHDFYGEFNAIVVYPFTTFQTTLQGVPRDPLRVNYLGRIDNDKRILEIIDIVEEARKRSEEDLTLYIAGQLEPSAYAQAVTEKCATRPWCRLVGKVYGEAKERFLLAGTYALHAQGDEAFGIAITEYLKAGLIPVVPDEGGAAEVVNAPELTYHDDHQAAEILARLLHDQPFRESLRLRCAERARAFDGQAQRQRIQTLLDDILGT